SIAEPPARPPAARKEAVPAVQPPAPPPAARKAPLPPAEPPGAPEVAQPPAVPARPVTELYRDHGHHSEMRLPEGWHRMGRTELDLIDRFLRERGLDRLVRYDTGFRPGYTSLGMYPYILVQIQPLPASGTSYDEIQQVLDLGLDGPLKEVEGTLSDL